MTLLLGLDIGTSGAKAALIDSHGKLLAWAGREYPIDAPQPGWAEQDPHVWLDAALASTRQVLADSGADPKQVTGIGLDGQMHSLVCLGENGQPLRPAILWADQRSAAQVEWLRRQISTGQLAEWTGNPVAAGFMLPSWLWLREHEPDVAAKTRRLLLPKDEVRYRLTGQIGSEPSDASSTLLFDPHARRWSPEMLALAGLNPEQMPEVHPSAQVAGGLLDEMARACGLLPGTPVVYGAGDQAAQAFGNGVIDPGLLSCTIGTGGQLFAPLTAPIHDPRLRLHMFCHCLPGRWHQEAAILSAGLSLRWLRDNLWPFETYSAMADAAQAVEAAAEGLFFLPYLAGERTPHMDPSARAAFIGLGLNHQRPHLIRAVMEGVVFALRQGLELMEELGAPVERLLASGGATRHPLWLQLQANIFGRPVYPSQQQEVTAKGAAMLAGIGVGVYADGEDAVRTAVTPPGEPVLPEPERVEMYQKGYEEYKKLYPALKLLNNGS